MLDPIVNFFTRIFQWIGRGIGFAVGVILWPFMRAGHWYTQRGWILKAVLGLALLMLIGLYGYFIWNTQVWSNFNPAYAEAYNFTQPAGTAPAQPAPSATGETAGVEGEVKTCTNSAIVQVAADLIDFNVNENAWISSMILYKLGFFGMDWDRTPFLDNKASFQRGVNQAIRRTAVELVDTLGRVRGTSQIDQNLQDARGAITFDEETWYFGLRPFGPKTPTPSFYRTAASSLRAFNDRLMKCEVVFNARADNLLQFVDRIASDIGSTSDLIRDRSQNFNSGWFDTRADDRFWFAYGQLYGYYGILTAAHHDFQQILDNRGLTPLWNSVEGQLKAALAIQPLIISNGREDGWIMPTHLTTMGFYVLRVRSNLVEVRSVLDR
ncbi:MAG: DUF2333 family protein [Mesorhizobium sp.]|uniref:DUF2333 family protein n=1 Tax=unclassified Mesorhizobium TaxID=325217 RepID=UPI000FD2337A|nr:MULTISPECIES: DUF2333 family protein [unclassified Mesorhizobium]RUV92232.1 DUF2333 family protein [Mesorhizobium sp. M5C.F.Ca.IN.020.14.1.1]RUV31393.1 DUF2333 family protein [Mesorhizobium sp. M5C.F.Ca.IN.020.32.2.1]RWD52115.1 MAG: DUF2333 family protein [Mesorhizobium sp.]RWE11096.1 MAG: DUF2333 family protein [Mesorhizobium sp.]RWE59970.1 MAG: DUF2333 family protein [Mesorhizobium sp.]